MSLKYDKVLVIGATSGIGEAYAEKVILDGKKVVIVGRRRERLDAFVDKYGQDRVDAIVFDITELHRIVEFVTDVTSRHPDLNSVVLNSGIQRGFDFSNPESIDLSVVEQELNTNYLSYVYLTHAFIPFLSRQSRETSLIYTSSGLALVPIVSRLNYSATKAALHHFVLCLREQLKDNSETRNIKVIEIFPPAVQTELHDAKHQPDIKDGRSRGMPLDQFVEESWAKLVRGDEQIPVGRIEGFFKMFEDSRQEVFRGMAAMVKEQQGT